MINHIGLRTKQPDTMIAFYQAALAPLGYTKLMEFEGTAGFGREHADVWVGTSDDSPTSQIHLALTADDHAAVDAFHAAAMANGARDNGGPGLRPEYSPNYYAAFVIDPDGNNLEVMCTSEG